MKSLKIITCLLFLILNQSVSAMEKIFLSVPSLDKDKSIVIELYGKKYLTNKPDLLEDDPLFLTGDRQVESNMSDLFKRYVEANKTTDINRILKQWATAEDKNGIRELFGDIEVLERNMGQFNALQKVKLLMYFEYKDYLIVLIDHEFYSASFNLFYVLKKTESGYLLTNQLSSDSVLNELTDFLFTLMK